MKKSGMFFLVMVLLSVFWAVTASARTNLQSTYHLWTDSQVTVLPADGDTTTSFVVVVDSNWARVPSEVCVNFIWQESFSGELGHFGQSQRICSGKDGVVYFPVPSCSGGFFRYVTLYADDVASVAHRLFWYTTDPGMPARLNFISGSPNLFLGETESYVFQVLNAWGTPLSGVRVQVIRGNGYTSPEVEVSDASGYVTFEFTAPSGAVGSEQLRVQVDPWAFLQAGLTISWSSGTTPPVPPLPPEPPVPPPTPVDPPSGTFTANPTSVLIFETATLTLTTANTTAVTLNPYFCVISGSLTAGGGTLVVEPTTTTTYTVTLFGSGGTTVLSATVTVDSGPPVPPPTQGVVTISAVNPTSYEGSLPVWTANVGQSVVATFVAKDSNGSSVAGANLAFTYPATTVTTDSSGQASVTIPASSFPGWDSDKIWLVSDSAIYLDFKIIYQ